MYSFLILSILVIPTSLTLPPRFFAFIEACGMWTSRPPVCLSVPPTTDHCSRSHCHRHSFCSPSVTCVPPCPSHVLSHSSKQSHQRQINLVSLKSDGYCKRCRDSCEGTDVWKFEKQNNTKTETLLATCIKMTSHKPTAFLCAKWQIREQPWKFTLFFRYVNCDYSISNN